MGRGREEILGGLLVWFELYFMGSGGSIASLAALCYACMFMR